MYYYILHVLLYCGVYLYDVISYAHVLTGFSAAFESTADLANFHGSLADNTGIHGQVHAC